eukprot:1482592-Rhodomonas_salina.2
MGSGVWSGRGVGSVVLTWGRKRRADMGSEALRKMCRLCADTDEWGQITLLNTFIHYGRCGRPLRRNVCRAFRRVSEEEMLSFARGEVEL